MRLAKRALWKLRGVQSLHNLRRARRDAQQLDPLHPERGPLLVYQMAKVGSTTAEATLAALDPPRPACVKVHFLSRQGVRRERALDRESGGPLYVSYQGALGLLLGPRVRAIDAGRLRVITLVRDPIAREVSGVFQIPHFYQRLCCDPRGRFDLERALAGLREHFAADGVCSGAERWFDEELREVLDIDVLSAPFPRGRGHEIVSGRRARVLLLRTEDLDRVLPRALADFLELPKEPPVAHANLRSNSPRGAEYAALLERFRLPPEVVDRVYAGRLARHFYSDELIDRFRRRWTRGS